MNYKGIKRINPNGYKRMIPRNGLWGNDFKAIIMKEYEGRIQRKELQRNIRKEFWKNIREGF